MKIKEDKITSAITVSPSAWKSNCITGNSDSSILSNVTYSTNRYDTINGITQITTDVLTATSSYKERYEELLEQVEGKKIKNILSKKEILDNIIEILAFLQKRIKKYGKPVCAGGAVRDLILGDESIQPKDYDIFIICGERGSESKVEALRQKLFSEIESFCKDQRGSPFSIDQEPPYNTYSGGNMFPLANLIFKNIFKVQIMYRPEIIGENDLVDSFDWNFSSAFISLCKDGICFGTSEKFPVRPSLLSKKDHGFFQNAEAFITALEVFSSKKNNFFPIVKNKKYLVLSLNDEDGFQTQGKNYDSCCYYTMHRVIDFVLKYKSIFKCRIRNKSLYRISKNIVSLQKPTE